MAKLSEAEQQKLAEATEKYRATITPMSHRELVDELESQALMANYGYRGPLTTMILKTAKAELLERLKGVNQPQKAASSGSSEDTPEPTGQKRPTLFG